MSDQSEELPLMAPPPTPTPTRSTSRPVQSIKFGVEFASKPTVEILLLLASAKEHQNMYIGNV
ncbi:hypothetical protein Gotur_017456 [Gossypium turneri]